MMETKLTNPGGDCRLLLCRPALFKIRTSLFAPVYPTTSKQWQPRIDTLYTLYGYHRPATRFYLPRRFKMALANGKQITNLTGDTKESTAVAMPKYVPSLTQLIVV